MLPATRLAAASITLTVPESVFTTYTSSLVGLAVTPVGLLPVARVRTIFSELRSSTLTVLEPALAM